MSDITSKGDLSYVRIARKVRDGADGVLYIHSWPTGNQELVFGNINVAKQFATENQLKLTQPNQRQMAELDRMACTAYEAQQRSKGTKRGNWRR